MHLRCVEVMGTDCQPIITVVGIRAATAAIEGQMVGGMLGQAPVPDKFAAAAMGLCRYLVSPPRRRTCC